MFIAVDEGTTVVTFSGFTCGYILQIGTVEDSCAAYTCYKKSLLSSQGWKVAKKKKQFFYPILYRSYLI